MLHYKNKYNNTNIRGFTIIELLIVIVIIGVLAAIIGVSYSNVVDDANRVTIKTIEKNVMSQAAIIDLDGGIYPQTIDGCDALDKNPPNNKIVCYKKSGSTEWTYNNGSYYNLDQTMPGAYNDILTPGYELTITSGKHFSYISTTEFVPEIGFTSRFRDFARLIANSGVRPMIIKFDAKSKSGNPYVYKLKLAADKNSPNSNGSYLLNDINELEVDVGGEYKTFEYNIEPIKNGSVAPTADAYLTFYTSNVQLKNVHIYTK